MIKLKSDTFSATHILVAAASLFFLAGPAQGQDFPYPPATWRTPICFPDDWLKSLIDNEGNLNYDFGPGPYARPKTTISIGIQGHMMEVTKQTIHSAKAPIVLTELVANGLSMRQTAFALVEDWLPDMPKDPNIGFSIKRRLGFPGAIGWAEPIREADPAFRNVAWGTGRPIIYHIPVPTGSRKRVALGFCDSYRKKGRIKRVMLLNVEGAAQQEIDLLVSGEQNEPQAFIFDGEDSDNDGQIKVEILASSDTHDPNVLLNVIWVFTQDYQISIPELIAGSLTFEAETYVDCGMEPQLFNFPQRRDVISATISGQDFTPIIEIRTNRDLSYDGNSGTIKFHEQPFLTIRPRPLSIQESGAGWILGLPKNTERVDVLAYNGNLAQTDLEFPEIDNEKRKAIDYWENEVDLPWGSIEVPDQRLQSLLVSSVRTLHQVMENVDGYPQFQPGPTVYRGFWASDGIWDADAALLVGDLESADLTVDRFIEHQNPEGRIEIMSPSLLHRETAHFMWLLQRYSEFTQDKEWLRTRWKYMEKAVGHYRQLRRISSEDAELPYYGLTPPGLTDGGIGGINAEYGGVYWGLIGLKSAIESARRLGEREQADAWQAEYDDFLLAFRRAAERDMRVDEHGNTFLPMTMAHEGNIPFPQRGQGQLCHTVFPGDIFGLEDPFIAGLFDIFDQNLVQGLVVDTGWLKGGVWPFFAAHRGLAELWMGRVEKAQYALEAFANHASPTFLWVEEQSPKDKGTRIAGDTPQTNASAQIIRLLRHLLVLERVNTLEVLHGLPEEWIKPSAVLDLDKLPTKFGRVSLHLEISENGDSGTLSINSSDRTGEYHRLSISLNALRNNGYRSRDGKPLPEFIKGESGEDVRLAFFKE